MTYAREIARRLVLSVGDVAGQQDFVDNDVDGELGAEFFVQMRFDAQGQLILEGAFARRRKIIFRNNCHDIGTDRHGIGLDQLLGPCPEARTDRDFNQHKMGTTPQIDGHFLAERNIGHFQGIVLDIGLKELFLWAGFSSKRLGLFFSFF